MWTREQLKNKAKIALRGNYWRVVLVTLIVFLIGGATANVGIKLDSDEWKTLLKSGIHFELGIFENIFLIIPVVIGFAVVIGIFLSIFIFNPLEIGTKRFYFMNLNRPADVKELAFAFDNNYKNCVEILFYRDLYVFGWTLLFIIPGIVKAYEYMMVPYLLAENPNLTKEQVFTLSKQMMTGNKWDAVVLEMFSFLGWEILSDFTCGILSVFYVEPYKNLTYAALYEELSLIHGRPATAMQKEPYMDIHSYEEEVPEQRYIEDNSSDNDMI